MYVRQLIGFFLNSVFLFLFWCVAQEKRKNTLIKVCIQLSFHGFEYSWIQIDWLSLWGLFKNLFGKELSNFHSLHRRVNSDLTLQMHITLVEALCGFQKPIKTLDDRTVVVSTIPGKLWADFFCFVTINMFWFLFIHLFLVKVRKYWTKLRWYNYCCYQHSWSVMFTCTVESTLACHSLARFTPNIEGWKNHGLYLT